MRLPTDEAFEVLSYLRKRTCLKRIPVLVYIHTFNPEVVDRARKLGANYIMGNGKQPGGRKVLQQLSLAA